MWSSQGGGGPANEPCKTSAGGVKEGVCRQCGELCKFGYISGSSLDQTGCDNLANELGTDLGCTFNSEDNGSCECPNIPEKICKNNEFTIYTDNGSTVVKGSYDK